MSYLALYRKYRPSSFDDLVGQNEVSTIIKNEILNDKISHAYLFSGPRGTGKTSTAKIIARMINCSNLSKDGVPCGKCESCLNINSNDIVEIDAASNNGVDEIRDLRDKVNLVPTYGKYKVYIIDEVHMLTTQAFNALLKTLEEPPKHAIFILATTEFYKIPATVVSRCQKFQFLKFNNDDIVDRLKNICKLEKIKVNDDILYEIARLSDGGLRDAINMLDQLSSFKDGNFDLDDIYKLNGVVSFDNISKLLFYILNNDVKNIALFVDDLNKKGINLDKFLYDAVDFLKDILIYKSTLDDSSYSGIKLDSIIKIFDSISEDKLYKFINSFNDILNLVKTSGFPYIVLTTNLICLSNSLIESVSGENKMVVNVEENVNYDILDDSIEDNIVNKSYDINKEVRINNTFATASKVYKENVVSKWDLFKESIINDSKYNSLVGIIDDIDVMAAGDNNIIFSVKYDSLIDRIYNYLFDFEKCIDNYYNNEYKVVFLSMDEWENEKKVYIDNIKKGKKYTYIEEVIEKNDDNVYTNSDVDKLVSLVGNDVITYK